MFWVSVNEIDHFLAVLVSPVLFVLGWALLYELFYCGGFVGNNYGVIGGLVAFCIAVSMIVVPISLAYRAFETGIIWPAVKDFFFVSAMIAAALVFMFGVLKIINLIVRRVSRATPSGT